MALLHILTCISLLPLYFINSCHTLQLPKDNDVADSVTEITSTERYTELSENKLSIYDDTETSEIDQRSCPVLEHWNNCFAHCQHNCSNWGRPMPCPAICVPGCVCDEEYVRGPENKCIYATECRKLNELFAEEDDMIHAPEMQACPSKEHWDWCNAGCQKTCANKGKPGSCQRGCKTGCSCNEGFVRGPDGKCILPSLCPFQEEKISEGENFCPPNEEFSRCLAHCQRNCSNWSDPTTHCQKICVPGCICKPGMVRGPHGNCIRPRKCPRGHRFGDSLSEPECPVEEHYDSCNAHCQKNCSTWNETMQCSQLCVGGCICDEGFVRSSSGRCIPSVKCSEQDTVAFSEGFPIPYRPVPYPSYDIPHCPDVHSCTTWCRDHGYHYGFCTSIFNIQCKCVP